jgi:hypothetical protein
VNQTDDWNDDFRLNFTIGTIHIKESWETTYRLKVNKEGVIDLFGNGSTIKYNGGSGSLNLPVTFIISVNGTIPLGAQSGILSVTDLEPDDYSIYYNDSVPMTWKLNYTAVGSDMATETYWYSYRGLPFIEFGSSLPLPSTNGVEIPRSKVLDVTKFPPGEYRIKVIAYVPGIQSAEDSGKFTKLPNDEKVNIWLK